MQQKFKERLIKYMNIEAMSRYEEPVAEELRNNINKIYEVSRDKFGSIIFHKPSKNKNAPKVMIAAHMDEVGYVVKSITKQGQILVSPIGGIWASTVIGTKAKLITSKNEEFLGVFGHTSIHIMEREKISKALTNDELYVDFGFASKEEAESYGVEIGDRIQMSGEVIEFKNPDLIGGKAMDNRAGVTVLETIANNIADYDLDVDLYLVGTVQEEVGTRGARTSVSIIKPDIAIALDTTSSHDTFGTIEGTTALFKGAALRVKDGGTLMDPKLVEFFVKTAQKHNIKAYKFVAAGGGTDAKELQFSPNGGAATITISLPQRYLHSPIGVCSISDLLSASDLIINFLKDLSLEVFENIKYK
ncbi:glutamyl aminopeptidase [Mycoplasmopsis canis UFG4]|uniref:Glutamyl aminopeptidase n=1 Tax=Mycoplasmopsis canis UFG4 TaxID=1131455 RepID=I1A5N2_9BACT|nr:M42 family metallopeptidase [Mycoplasmopsis canis]EIE40022.1 glutamyl aminopeptidase [Mycoplasmopsis canis UF31]EIE41803.1 glutamyl aminopeptidase [Mycoplasmopsis canis UFG4]